jgi:hypothetical protein
MSEPVTSDNRRYFSKSDSLTMQADLPRLTRRVGERSDNTHIELFRLRFLVNLEA